MAIVLLDIEDNWYYFLRFRGTADRNYVTGLGVILLISIIVLVFEAKSEDDEILHIKPFQVFRNIILNQVNSTFDTTLSLSIFIYKSNETMCRINS